MTSAEILGELEALAAEHLGTAAPLRPEHRLVEDLELDSVRLLTLAVQAENRFRVRLDAVGSDEIETVGDLVEAIGAALDQPTEPAAESDGESDGEAP